MKLGMSLRQEREPNKKKQRRRTHTTPPPVPPLARQMRKLRRHYDRMSALAARLQGRPLPRPGVALKIAMAATVKQLGCSRREAAVHLLRDMAAAKAGGNSGAVDAASQLAITEREGEWEA